MMIAMARFVKRFGLTTVGVQYQRIKKIVVLPLILPKVQLGQRHRFPLPDENGDIISPNTPILVSTKSIWVQLFHKRCYGVY